MRDEINKNRANLLQVYGNADEIIKGGEGSKGGHVIGHTSSGKPIYESGASHPAHKDFTEQDHQEAHLVNHRQAIKHLDAMQGEKGLTYATHNLAASKYLKASDSHHEAAEKIMKKDAAASLKTPAPEGMKHLKHEDGVSHGGFSAKVWNSPHIQNYTGGFGAIYHSDRTPETDKHLEDQLAKHGLHADEAAEFLTSRVGRHTMDSYSFGKDRVERDISANIDWFRKQNK